MVGEGGVEEEKGERETEEGSCFSLTISNGEEENGRWEE